jgi:hypothetical protein
LGEYTRESQSKRLDIAGVACSILELWRVLLERLSRLGPPGVEIHEKERVESGWTESGRECEV